MTKDTKLHLEHAFEELIDACTRIGDLRAADAGEVDYLAHCVSEVRYWTAKAEELGLGGLLSERETLQ